MKRPEIMCLMMITVDGKILAENWGTDSNVKELANNFEKAHDAIGVPAWIVGRTTMEKDFTKGAKPVIKEGRSIDRNDFVGNKNAESFAIAVDAHAKLGWEKSDMHGDHVITLLTEAAANDGYLAHLQDIGVSYVFAGKNEINLELALQKLYSLFGIEKLMLEGGGHLNGSFLNEGLIDELNLLVLPMADGTANTSTVFDINKAAKKGGATVMKLKEVKQIENDVLWLKYTFK